MSSQLTSRVKLDLGKKLREPNRRRKSFHRMAQDEIAMQISALREERGFRSKSAFARHAKMQQSAVSRIENADYKGWTFKTLLKVADLLDARLRVSFERAEDVIRRFEQSEAEVSVSVDVSSDPKVTKASHENTGAMTLDEQYKGVPIELIADNRSTDDRVLADERR